MIWRHGLTGLLALAALLAAPLCPALAKTWLVGSTRPITLPSAAVRQASDGDTVLIDPGEYFDCISTRLAHLTIAGADPAASPGAVLTDRLCDGKALVVAAGDAMVLRNLTLQRARSPDGNGAGIRVEARDLQVLHDRFVNDQSGILAGGAAGGSLLIADSFFSDIGECNAGRCLAVIATGSLDRLRVERTTITAGRGGAQIATSARVVELSNDQFTDGPTGLSGFAVTTGGGNSLVMEDTLIERGPKSTERRAAVLVDGSIAGPFAFRRNRFENHTGAAMPFILNWTGTSPVLAGNVIGSNDTEITSHGQWLHEMRQNYDAMKDQAHGLAAGGYHSAANLWHALRH